MSFLTGGNASELRRRASEFPGNPCNVDEVSRGVCIQMQDAIGEKAKNKYHILTCNFLAASKRGLVLA
jgi:hypothetical protein